jgi:hypothetical protein
MNQTTSLGFLSFTMPAGRVPWGEKKEGICQQEWTKQHKGRRFILILSAFVISCV